MLLALDISTSVVGIAIFGTDHKLHEISYIKFDKKEKSLFKKLDAFIEHIEKYNITFTQIAVESPLLRMAGRFSSAETLQKLTTMNALVCGYLYRKYGIEPVYFNVQAARKLAFPDLVIPKQHPNKKYLVWESVMKTFPQVNWIYSKNGKLVDENFDMSDAITVGLSFIVSSIKLKLSGKTEVVSGEE
jgi:hypothetical protein